MTPSHTHNSLKLYPLLLITLLKFRRMHAIDFKEIQEKLSDGFRPWQRSFQFWARATDIYTGYKVSLWYDWYSFLLHVSFLIHFLLILCNSQSVFFFPWAFRYFNFVWTSLRMSISTRKCGRDNMNLLLTKFIPCALTLVVSSLRWCIFLPILHFRFLVYNVLVCWDCCWGFWLPEGTSTFWIVMNFSS